VPFGLLWIQALRASRSRPSSRERQHQDQRQGSTRDHRDTRGTDAGLSGPSLSWWR